MANEDWPVPAIDGHWIDCDHFNGGFCDCGAVGPARAKPLDIVPIDAVAIFDRYTGCHHLRINGRRVDLPASVRRAITRALFNDILN